VIFNPTAAKLTIEIQINNQNTVISIDAKALQTVVIKK
jgi:glucosylceramidase